MVGCSGSFPGPESPASCYLVEADDAAGRTWRVLLDLGNGALGPLQRFCRPEQVDAVLLSHLHPDHCLDLCGLYVALRYHPDVVATGPAEQLAVFGPSRTLDKLIHAYDLDGETAMAALLKVHQWQDRQPVTIGPFTVTPYLVEHPVEAYGLRLELDGTVLAYTGDTDSCPALLDLARDADLLLAEASFVEGRDDDARGIHLTGRRAGEAAAEAGARRLVLTHLPPWNDPEVVLAEARQTYPGPIALAATGQVHELPGGPQ